MRTYLSLAVLCSAALVAIGCATNKTAVRYSGSMASMSSPVVQQLLADAATQAVEQAMKAGDWKTTLRGKKVTVEVQGVLLMGYDELPGFVKAAIEAELAKAGAIVFVQKPTAIISGERLPLSQQDPDFRVVASLVQGGIDASRKGDLDVGTLLLQGGLMAGGVVLGVTLAEPIGPWAAAPAGSAILGGAVWMVLAPPLKYTYTLTSKVALSIYLLPQSGLGTFAGLSGAGEKAMEIPATPEGPYVLITDTPF